MPKLRDTSIRFKCSSRLKKQVRLRASLQDKSMSQYIIDLINEDLRTATPPPRP